MKAALYLRVSTSDQTFDNQMPALEAYALARGMEITGIYQEEESAWRAGHQKELARLKNELLTGKRKYDVLIVWSLDRLTRQGIGSLLETVYSFEKLGCRINSVKEEFVNVDGPMRDIFLALLAWVAKFESDRRSERTRAGLDRVRKYGSKSGLKIGERGKDKEQRHRAGYLQRYAGKG